MAVKKKGLGKGLDSLIPIINRLRKIQRRYKKLKRKKKK